MLPGGGALSSGVKETICPEGDDAGRKRQKVPDGDHGGPERLGTVGKGV